MPHVNGYTQGRYDSNTRWPGRLQTLLGDSFQIIEDGYGGRTTIIDESKPGREGQCGIKSLVPALKENGHLDLVIFMLGTNDMKVRFGLDAKAITANVEVLIRMLLDSTSYPDAFLPKVLLMSPTLLDQNNPEASPNFPDGTEKSKQLGDELKALAIKYNLLFLDLATIANPSPTDGMHLTVEGHAKIAESIYNIVREVFAS
jgi:lysophospholipase L1-like esterase